MKITVGENLIDAIRMIYDSVDTDEEVEKVDNFIQNINRIRKNSRLKTFELQKMLDELIEKDIVKKKIHIKNIYSLIKIN